MQLPEQRVCSKCGTVRETRIEYCPQCGTRRSRRLQRRIVSFWKLNVTDRRRLAAEMLNAVRADLSDQVGMQRLFLELQLPPFKEFRRLYRILRWTWITDGEPRIRRDWYLKRPDARVNPFTGLLWPPRDL